MNIEEQATGCINAGSYKEFAEEQGFKYVEVLNWMSSAGDWQFLVSRDGDEWYILEQVNNYPRQGFSHHVLDEMFLGTVAEVCEQIEAMYG